MKTDRRRWRAVAMSARNLCIARNIPEPEPFFASYLIARFAALSGIEYPADVSIEAPIARELSRPIDPVLSEALGAVSGANADAGFGADPSVIGWFYQYFNERRRDSAVSIFRRSVTRDESVAATQVFTPPGLAQYLIEETVGRWFAPAGGSAASPGPGEPPSAGETRELPMPRVLDPCVGAGHLLLAAFDRMLRESEHAGILSRDRVLRILKSLHGFDVDPVVAGIARASLYFRAASVLNLRSFDADLRDAPDIRAIDHEAGSLLRESASPDTPDSYDIVVTNPPYLNKLTPSMRAFIEAEYPGCGRDLFAAFVVRSIERTARGGRCALVTPSVWLFIRSYEPLRRCLLEHTTIRSLVRLAYSGFRDATVPICAFVLENIPPSEDSSGEYIELSGSDAEDLDRPAARYRVRQSEFVRLPGAQIAYWTDGAVRRAFRRPGTVGDSYIVRQGIATGDNERFLRLRHEIPAAWIGEYHTDEKSFCRSGSRYAPYNKGGAFRRFYGNYEYVIRYDEEARASLAASGNRLPSRSLYFRPSLTWSFVTSKAFGVRYSPGGFLFDVGGSSIFERDEGGPGLMYLLAYLNSGVCAEFARMLNPTINMQVGDVKSIPFARPGSRAIEMETESLARESVRIMKSVWDESERSADYVTHPLLARERSGTLSDRFEQWRAASVRRKRRLLEIRARLGEIFESVTGVTPTPESVRATELFGAGEPDFARCCEELVSHAIGRLFAAGTTRSLPLSGDGVCRTAERIRSVLRKAAFSDRVPLEEEALPGKSLESYLTRHFEGAHSRTYRGLPIYWAHEGRLWHYHRLRGVDYDRGIRANFADKNAIMESNPPEEPYA